MRGDRGMTLIELVVAMAIFALVAVMGLQGVTGMMRMRDRLAAHADTTEDLARATALLRADLGAAVPLLFFPPNRVPPHSALTFDAGAGALSLSVAGQPGLMATAGPGFGRVEWRLDPVSRTLFRREWGRLAPANRSAEGPEVAVIEDVSAIRLRSYWDDVGWVEGASPGRRASLVIVDGDEIEGGFVPTSSDLPQGIEITLDTGRYGTITLLEAMK